MCLKLFTLVLVLLGKVYGECCGSCGGHGSKEKIYATKNQEIQIKDPYFILLKGASNGAAYCTFSPKELDEDDFLESVEYVGSSIDKIELHTHIMDGNVAKMREVEKFTIDRKEGKKLEPGKDHIMLINLASDFKETELALILKFKKAGKVKVVFNKKEMQKPCCN